MMIFPPFWRVWHGEWLMAHDKAHVEVPGSGIEKTKQELLVATKCDTVYTRLAENLDEELPALSGTNALHQHGLHHVSEECHPRVV